jgi:imidazole glycerol-phosphate synthase subunit HisH
MARTAILDYEAGNLTSVERAVRHLGFDGEVTRDPRAIRSAERVIFPGVGAAGASMENLLRLGLEEEVRRAVSSGKPVLGICIGCQVVFERSDEDGGVRCLGLLPGGVRRFEFPEGSGLKVPHMGWNGVAFVGSHPVLAGLAPPAGSPPTQFYFVHSYYPAPADRSLVLGTAEYGGVEFAAVVGRENLLAVQFHAEKSGRPGLKLLESFLRWSP